MSELKVKINVDGSDYVVPQFLAAIDELYCFFGMHVQPHQENCLRDAMRMYADHQDPEKLP